MSENQFTWHVWDATCKDHEPDKAKNYIRLIQRKHGIGMSICDKDGTLKKSGHILCVEFQTGVILMLQAFNSKYGLKTDFDGTPLTVKQDAWERFVDAANKESSSKHSNDDSECSVTLPPTEVFAKLNELFAKIKEDIGKA